MVKISPSIRERQIFAALMEELLGHMPKGSKNFPTARTYLEDALRIVKARTGRIEEREAEIQAAIDKEISHTDYRE